ncbi:MAG: hypothetical protein AAFY01_01205, partial [Pseudomonadota bacterium]
MRRGLLAFGALVLCAALGLWWLLTPGTARDLAVPAGDRIEMIEPLSSYTALQGRALMWLAGIDGISPDTTIDTYRVTYAVPGAREGAQSQTGLLALPRGREPRSLVSWQHGTTTSPDYVPSNLSVDGLAASLLFAGRGHALVAADYEGLGGSQTRIHPYLIVEPTVASVLGLIEAARTLPALSGADDLFLAGFSQGANASMATHRQIEADGGTVLGTAAIAGGVNLRQISLPEALAGDAPNDVLYLAYMVRGYTDYYGHAPETVLSADYAGRLEEIFGAGLLPDDILAALPRDPKLLFNESFLAAARGEGEHWMLEAVAANEPVDWAPRAPMRLYYGEADKDVVPAEADMTRARMLAQGDANVITQSVGPV